MPDVCRTPNEYQETFEPLLKLEAWQSLVKSREDNNAKPITIPIISRTSVDSFHEVSSSLPKPDGRNGVDLSEGDILLLSQNKIASPEDRTCLALVHRMNRKASHYEVVYRVLPSNPLQSALVPRATVFGTKIQSITPLEREYGALKSLQYYDLCDEISRARVAPMLTYSDNHLDPLMSNYGVNRAQAKAIKSAMDNDAFTLIQG